MDSVFGIGIPELVVILILASIVMGPKRMQQAARWLGLITTKLQGISREFTRQLNAELDSIDEGDDLRGAVNDMKLLQRQVADLRRELTVATMGSAEDAKARLRETEDEIKRSIAPPELQKKGENGVDSEEIAAKDETAVSNPTSSTTPTASFKLPNPVEVADDPE